LPGLFVVADDSALAQTITNAPTATTTNWPDVSLTVTPAYVFAIDILALRRYH
jgi:hypothetical protein